MADTPEPGSILTLNGIDAEVMADGYRKGSTFGGGPWREIRYLVNWDQSDAFIDALIGLVQPTIPGQPISRTPPHQYPGNTILYCLTADVDPAGTARPDAARLFAADKAIVRARYEIPRTDIGGGNWSSNTVTGTSYPWSTQTVNGRTRIIQVPAEALKDKTTGGAAPEAKPFPLRVNLEEIVVTYEMVPYIYLPSLRNLAKHVNIAAFMGWGIGQVLFDEYRFSRQIMSDGSIGQKLELIFLAQSILWNSLPKEDDLDHAEVEGKASNTPPYPLADLTPLLTMFTA